jgi:pimeloyl-ACP methyl ester carboxylesterase
MLHVALNRLVLLESKRRFKQRVKGLISITDFRKTRPQYGLRLPLELSEKTRHLVISVHGYNAFAEDLDGILATVKSNGLPCARFCYPNDQPIDASAQLLSRELARLRKKYEPLRVSLVTHSMGGLVARKMVEDAKLDPGNVTDLIMIAPPNHGSELAQFAFAMDLWQLACRRPGCEDLAFFYTSVEDGMAEAATDLQPNSIFLIKLNRAKRNPDIEYSIFLGNRAPIQHEDVNNLRDQLASAGHKSRWFRFFGGKLDSMIGELDALVNGNGDGVVSVESGQLAGVDDVVVLPFSHVSVLRDPESKTSREVGVQIAERLAP